MESGQKDQENLPGEMGKTFLVGEKPGQGLESNVVLGVMGRRPSRNLGVTRGVTWLGLRDLASRH